jgi:uncharacterized protein (DUF2147 family)
MKHKPSLPLLPRSNTYEKRVLVFLILFSGFCAPIHLLFAATPIGVWYAEGGAAQVEIRQCEHALCGRVVWLRSPLADDGCPVQDQHNPEPSLRNRSVLGLEILQGLTPDDSTHREWSGGSIYDPSSGNTYACRLIMDGEHRLQLRGYVGIPLIGRTTTWIRVGTEPQQCEHERR